MDGDWSEFLESGFWKTYRREVKLVKLRSLRRTVEAMEVYDIAPKLVSVNSDIARTLEQLVGKMAGSEATWKVIDHKSSNGTRKVDRVVQNLNNIPQPLQEAQDPIPQTDLTSFPSFFIFILN